MTRGEHLVARFVNERTQGLGRLAPQKEDQSLSLRGKPADGLAGHRLPAPSGVSERTRNLHRKDRIEKKHAGIGPVAEVSAGARRLAGLRGHLEDVTQRRRQLFVRRHREGKTAGLAGRVIGVLPEDHGPDGLKRRPFHRPEGARREDVALAGEHALNRRPAFGRTEKVVGELAPDARQGIGGKVGADHQ